MQMGGRGRRGGRRTKRSESYDALPENKIVLRKGSRSKF